MFTSVPLNIQKLAEAAFHQFRQDPSHPSLRHHSLEDNDKGRHKKGSVSVAITMKYRAIYFVDGETNVWYWIGTHNDYENFTGKK
jgi:hypothetical protein